MFGTNYFQVTTVLNITLFGVDAYIVLEILRKKSGMEPDEFFKPP